MTQAQPDHRDSLIQTPESNPALAAALEARRKASASKGAAARKDAFRRAENEDDDGYDPYSDRLPDLEAQFQQDPWS